MPKGKPGITYVEFTCLACGTPTRRAANQIGRGQACSRACAALLIGGGREARFWARVHKTETCWLWAGATNHTGYGVMRPHVGRMIRMHRYSWELHNGPIPDGRHVLHACDNPPCVNPAHLFLGTHADNMEDMATKGRGRHPTKYPAAEIARRLATGERRKDLAAEFGTSPQYIGVIAWRHQRRA